MVKVEELETKKRGNVTTVTVWASIMNTTRDLVNGGNMILYYEGSADDEKLDKMRFRKEYITYLEKIDEERINEVPGFIQMEDGYYVRAEKYHPRDWAERWVLSFGEVLPFETVTRWNNINIQSLDSGCRLYLAYPSPFTVARHDKYRETPEWPQADLIWRVQ